MTCHDVRALYSDWVDEALTAEERARVEAHLAQCADCRKELERFTATLALLHRVERPRAPVGFVDRVLAAKPPAPWHRRLFQRLFLPLSVKLPAEAAALLLVAGLALHIFQRTPELGRAARQDTLAPAEGPEAARSTLRDRPPGTQPGLEGTLGAKQEARARSTPPDATRNAPLEHLARPDVGSGKQEDVQVLTSRPAPEPPAAEARRAPAEHRAKTAPAPAPAAGAAAPAMRDESSLDVKNEAKLSKPAAPSAPGLAPPGARPAPAREGRADSERDTPVGSPTRAAPPGSPAVRVPPPANVVGRLTVKDRSAAEQALGAALARSGGVLISRRAEPGATVMEVAVPRTAYPEFSQSLARLGAWQPEAEPSELPPDVRVTLRLVE